MWCDISVGKGEKEKPQMMPMSIARNLERCAPAIPAVQRYMLIRLLRLDKVFFDRRD